MYIFIISLQILFTCFLHEKATIYVRLLNFINQNIEIKFVCNSDYICFKGSIFFLHKIAIHFFWDTIMDIDL